MKREYFRILVGTSVIFVHSFCFLIIFYYKDDFLTMSQKMDMALLIMPISAAYASAVVRSALERGRERSFGPKMNINYSVIVILVTGMSLVGLLITVINITGAAQDDRRAVLLF